MTRWMTCREFVDFLDDYLARRLELTHREEFNDHLSGCPPCVAYMHSYQESIRLGKAALTRSEATNSRRSSPASYRSRTLPE